MNPAQEAKLDKVVEVATRVDERTLEMKETHEREIAAVHHRITEVRGEAAQDVKDLRGEVKRLSGIISTAVSAVIAAAGQALGIGSGS